MKTLNIGHRGASAYAPENTVAAFQRALEMGADGVELDVTLTRDGVPVVIHDDAVDRTTNGHGPIQAMTLQEVQALDAGTWFDARFRGVQIPTLQQVLQAVGTRGIVNIELKSTSLRTDGLEAAVVQVIQETGMSERVIISSFNPMALRRMAQQAPTLPRGLLYHEKQPIHLSRAWLRPLAQPTAMHPRYPIVTPDYVRWAREHHYDINTWTVNEPEEMKRLVDLGIHAIITNKPDVLSKVLAGK